MVSLQPLSVDALLVDFEAEIPTSIFIPRVGKSKFRLGSRHPSIFNLQIYTTFPKGLEIVYNKYVSVKHGRRRYSSWITKELKIETVMASEKGHNNRPLYLIDGKEDTFWSGEEGSWIQADLGLTRLVYGFEIHWLKGSSEGSRNLNHFEVAFSEDGNKPRSFIRLASTGSREEIYYVDEPEPPEARYMRLRFGQNQDNNRFGIVSLKIFGNNYFKRK